MKVQDSVSLVTFRVDPPCGLMGSGSSTWGEGPVDRAYKGLEGAEGSDTISVRFLLDPLVILKCLEAVLPR